MNSRPSKEQMDIARSTASNMCARGWHIETSLHVLESPDVIAVAAAQTLRSLAGPAGAHQEGVSLAQALSRSAPKHGRDIMEAPEWGSYTGSVTSGSLERLLSYLGKRLRESGSHLDYGLFAVSALEDLHAQRVGPEYGLLREVQEYYGVTTEA